VKCSFCGNEVPRGRGKIVVKREGTAYFFCSKKCEMNLLKLQRKPAMTKWTKEYHKQKEFLVHSQTKQKKKEEVKEEKGKEKKKEENK